LATAREVHPLAAELVEPLLALTLAPTMIAASQKRNVIPALCEVTVDCRLLPGDTPAGVEPLVRSVLGEGDYDLAWIQAQGEPRFGELGINIGVLEPGQPSCMYHRENAQEDFLVLFGECLLLVEGEERQLKAWDFVHCPPWTNHVFVGAGNGPCAILAVGRRPDDEELFYPVEQVALAHGAGVEEEPPDPK